MKKIVVITLLELKKTKNEKNCFNHFHEQTTPETTALIIEQY